jgi:site-specific recombinase XerD
MTRSPIQDGPTAIVEAHRNDEKSNLPAELANRPSAAALKVALQSASDYAAASKSEATKRAYRSDWADFHAWCESVHAAPLPCSPETLASYLAQLADRGKKVSTIRRRIAAISYAHRLKGLTTPGQAEPVRAVLAGIRRKIGVAVGRKAPATARTLAKMTRQRAPRAGEQTEAASCDLRSLRDRALLLLGFAAALRRSELVALDVGDLEFTERGVIIRVRRSKTDQDAAGAEIAVPNGSKLKPVAALSAWLDALARASGLVGGASALPKEAPVFRPIGKGGMRVAAARLTDRSVAEIVKKYAALGGFDAATFSGHSMRAGFITSALEHGADFFKVMDVSRHRDVDVMRGYDRRAKRFKDHAGKDFL